MHAHEQHEQPAPSRPPADRRPRPGAGAPADPAGLPGGLTPDALLALQRRAGNRAISAALARRAAAPPGTGPGAPQSGSSTEPDPRGTVEHALSGPGQPLEPGLRSDMEHRFGADFSDVRVHTGTAAQRSATALGARAYTTGSHVVIGPGGDDRHTLAHELTHVLQQRSGPVSGTDTGTGLRVSDPADRFERAAEANAHRVMSRPAPDTGTVQPATAPGGERLRQEPIRWAEADAPLQLAPPPAPAPAPVLTGPVDAGQDEEGRVGYFSRVRNWQVAHPRQGVIIQHVTRAFNVEQYQGGTWQPLAGAALDAYVTDPNSSVHATVQEYWELWTVDASGVVDDLGTDTFGLCSIIPNQRTLRNTSRGTFTIRGEARFYPTPQPPTAMGFARGPANSVAGGLFVRGTDPAADLATLGLAASGPPVIYQVTATWDSSGASRADAPSMFTIVT